MKVFKQTLAFEWDKGNQDKNLVGHKVTNEECEEVFYDPKKKIADDPIHSQKENRYIVIGKTKQDRILFLVFTIRNEKIRVISARDLNKKERFLYEEKN